ncbi:hypothetical protein HCN44_001742 [Aphidius gifuensis]|uniref:Uncharacterized protein n=1 Tax=Aphidius gifuensis TaxID=684658 RepID=A0A835CQM6_APHGI|nr:hypothetical protein HCN44_001742 [Aphidius gifuensis]
MDQPTLRKYLLVEWVTRGPKPSIRKIDIILSSWLQCVKEHGKAVVKAYFPPAPYDKLDELLQTESLPVDSWKLYTATIIGEADSLTTIKDHFKKLEDGKKYGFSSGSDNTQAERAVSLENMVKISQCKKQEEQILARQKKLMDQQVREKSDHGFGNSKAPNISPGKQLVGAINDNVIPGQDVTNNYSSGNETDETIDHEDLRRKKKTKNVKSINKRSSTGKPSQSVVDDQDVTKNYSSGDETDETIDNEYLRPKKKSKNVDSINKESSTGKPSQSVVDDQDVTKNYSSGDETDETIDNEYLRPKKKTKNVISINKGSSTGKPSQSVVDDQDVINNFPSGNETDETINNEDLRRKKKNKNVKSINKRSSSVKPLPSASVGKKINQLFEMVKDIKKNVQELKNGNHEADHVDIEKKYNIILPIRNFSSLVSLEKKLMENNDGRKDIVAYMKFIGQDAKTLPDFTRRILKSLFIQKVAVKLSAARQRDDKFCMAKVLPATRKCILDAIKGKKLTLKDSTTSESVLSSCLIRATDWNAQRKKKKTTPKNIISLAEYAATEDIDNCEDENTI